MNREHLQTLVELWGEMGAVWGINRSMARVHALLIGSDGPISLDDIADRLDISRGNASMVLKELRSWGVVRRVRTRGDRRDFYVSEPDMWTMFFRIVRERKRRELDPALAELRRMLAAPDLGASPEVTTRLEQMEELLATGDRLLRQFLRDEHSGRSILALLSGLTGGEGGRSDATT
jgi:DNA-binding transcriptional regulator GbsR (MarR family)